MRCVWLLLLAGCSRCEEPAQSGILTLGTLFEPTTLDPAFAASAGEREIVELLYRDLTVIDDRGRVLPGLADLPQVTTGTGAQRVRWHLREGYAWSDGRAITSDDVLFGYRIQKDESLAAINHQIATKVERMEADGPRAVTVVWKRAYLDHDEPRTHVILPAHAYPQPKGASFAGMIRADVSSGPFSLAEWVPGQYLAVKKNEGWGGEGPSLDRIVFRFFKAEDGLLAALEAGEIDAAGEASGLGLDASDLARDRLKATHAVDLRNSGNWLHLVVRLDHPLLKDPRARRAIAKAIDRDVLAKVLYGGHGAPAFGIFPEGHPGHAAAGELAFDREAARAAMAEVPGDKKLELVYSGGPPGARAAEVVAEDLRKIGLEVETVGVHFRVLSEELRRKEQAPLALYLLRSTPLWDGRSIMHSGGGQNFSGLSDPEIDRTLDLAERSADRAEWARHVLQVNLQFQETLPAIPLLFKGVGSVRPRWLTGWSPTGTRTPVTWNAERWRRSP